MTQQEVKPDLGKIVCQKLTVGRAKYVVSPPMELPVQMNKEGLFFIEDYDFGMYCEASTPQALALYVEVDLQEMIKDYLLTHENLTTTTAYLIREELRERFKRVA